MATITLKYQKNQSHEIRVEKLNINYKSNKWDVQETSSFFMDEYKEAIEMVNAIIALCKGKKEDEKRNGSATKESESINNRILFVGQRGTGKTSAMTSFAKALDEANLDNENVFKHLPLIDPSNFDNNTNILLTVITMMFSEAKKMMKNDKNDEDIISIREDLLRKFDEVFKSLKAITNSERPTFTLEGLNEKSRALQMRIGMHCLVKSYIEFYNKVNKTRLSHLVLLIDDIDMTVSHVPEMLEQLRKYLDLDNLLILMSANLGQLYNEMREHYSKAFKETLNDRNQALSIDVEDLANKYLLKLFPTSRRIRVEHSVKQLLETRLEIKDAGSKNTRVSFSNAKGSFSGSYRKENDKFSGNFEIDDVGVNGNSTANPESESIEGYLQNVVLSLIWQKTRLLFIPKDANTMLHPIIPTNLRELMQFLDMLTSLKPVAEKNSSKEPRLFGDLESYDNCKDNLGKFKSYILHNWIPNHLSVEEELVFENIPTDITEINKHLINAINMIGTNHKKDLMSREVGLDIIERNAENVYIDRDIYTMVSPNDPKFVKANKISDIFNQPSNYSYGDLLLMIDKYETYFESGDDRKFTDAIKVYYSILLFETMFFKSNTVEYEMTSGDYYSKQLLQYTKDCVNDNSADNRSDLKYDVYKREITTDNSINQAAENITSVKNELASAKSSLAGLSEGSEEYVTALNKVNEARSKMNSFKNKLMDLLQKKAVVEGVDGIGEIKEGRVSATLERARIIFAYSIIEYHSELEEACAEIWNKTIHHIIPIQRLIGGNVYYPNYFEIITDRYFNQKGPSFDAKRAFYHKINLGSDPITAKGKISDECPLFSVLYYGDIRPDRYETTHIYDTTFDNNAKIDSDYYVTFDMLSIFNNMLNPWQTICRTDNVPYIDEWKNSIENWGKECTIDIEKRMPNSILPFYSVDIMLSYLKSSYKAKDIAAGNDNPSHNYDDGTYLQEENIIDTDFKKFFTDQIDDINKNKTESISLEILNNIHDEYVKIINSRVIETKTGNNNTPANYSIKNDVRIIDSVSDFRSFAISEILARYEKGKRSRDVIIKSLHKINTVSEIYKYLVEELFVNEKRETEIKKRIQQCVHDKNAVEQYYNKLWDITKDKLSIMNCKDVYQTIFTNAVKYFIREED